MKNKYYLNEFSKETNEVADKLRLFDDDFMKLVFSNNKEAVECVLNIILERDDLIVEEVTSQDYIKNLFGYRDLRIDVYAKDKNGKEYNIEIQRANSGASTQRARFHSAMIDSKMLLKGQDYKDLKESFVIFVCEDDFFKGNLPIYHVDRIVDEINKPFEDGSHIIYVNGKFKDTSSDIGRLVHDFSCVEPSSMYIKPLKKVSEHYKQVSGGRKDMCQLIDDLARTRYKTDWERKSVSDIIKFVNSGMDVNRVFEILETDDHIKKLVLEELNK